MKYYIIAGEASGDLHASRLIHALRQDDPDAVVRAWGGDLMHAEGAVIVKHYRELAFMGFIEVVANLRTILRNMAFCKKDLLEFNPDIVIFVDYPGFNIPMAKFAKQQGYKTAYYISPQVWAWKENRVNILRKVIDRMMVILPFEKAFYKKWDYEVDYVGHPLIEIIEDYKRNNIPDAIKASMGIEQGKKTIALLPGSRKQEIAKKLPIMLEASVDFPEHVFVVGQAPGISDDVISEYTKKYQHVKVLKGNTYGLLSIADAALVTSGTATLETALFGVPEVVCYKGSYISYTIAKKVIKVAYISLVNLIMNRLVVKELIQEELTAINIKKELTEILENEQYRNKLLADYKELNTLLADGGKASEKAAAIIRSMR
ncbi:MAG: lipid-A-disaccharide synthase [bacterium]